MNGDAFRVHGCDLLQLDTTAVEHLGLSECIKLTDQCLEHRCKLRSIDIRNCRKLTVASVSALGYGSGQLQSIDLAFCKVTDAGVSALSQGCGQMLSINLYHCQLVTDAGLSALGRGCGQLQNIDLGASCKVTDAGISALGQGCGQL